MINMKQWLSVITFNNISMNFCVKVRKSHVLRKVVTLV